MTSGDAIRVRLLARHFNDMQGLRHVLVGLCLTVPASAYIATQDPTETVILLLVAFLAMSAGSMRLDRYYAQEFGRVPSGNRAGYIAGTVYAVSSLFDQHLTGLPSVFWAFLVARELWIVWDCWPFRRYHLATAAASIYVSFTHTRIPAISTYLWFAQGVLVVCWAAIPTGIADHLLLARLMRRQREGDAQEAR
jgi:hypothetical protein